MWSLPETITLPPLRLPPLPEKELLLSTAATFAASAILFRSVVSDLIPDTVTAYLSSRIKRLTTGISSQLTVVIDDFDGLTANQMFAAANLYLASNLARSTARIKVKKPEKENELDVTIDRNQELVDFFRGAKMKWSLYSSPLSTDSASSSSYSSRWRGETAFPRSEVRHFELVFHKKHRKLVLGSYLPHILAEAKSIREAKKTVKLHTIDYNGTDYWGSVVFDHPATFDTIAMDPETKKALVADLETFVERKDFYRKVGKAWKRGYLLYGPPGTGKSSLVAAMANYLKFDVYDLDLKEIQCNSDLRRLLIGTGNKSILVLEDIDRTVGAINEEKVSLAGLLNFVDGLWSTCGEERIIVFTTNHKEELDPALLRPGRIDVELHMSYCSFTAFKALAYNYLEETDHELFGEIKELLEIADATPAEVAGELLKSKNVDVALHGVVKLLRSKESAAANGSRTATVLSLGTAVERGASRNGVENNTWGDAFHYNGGYDE